MKKKVARFVVPLILSAFCAQLAAGADPSPEYLYEDTDLRLPFSVSVSELRAVDTPEKARRVFRGALEALSEADKTQPYVSDALALLAEECIRYGGADDPNIVRIDMLDSAAQYGVEFPRELRTGATVRADARNLFETSSLAPEPADVDFIYADTPFAVLRIPASEAAQSVSVRLLGAAVEPERPSALSVLLRLWSVWAILAVLLVSLLIESLRKRKVMRMIVPAICVVLAAANILPIALTRDPLAAEEEPGVEVLLGSAVPAMLSVPPSNEDEAELAIVDENGSPVPCKYNPITRMVDARIAGSGKYYLKLSAVYFTDIGDKSAEMQRAIRTLTSLGLMDGADERTFLPDREITRAEFLSVVLRVMNLIDEDAKSSFPDVLRNDWFYAVAASAEKERLISGYDDGTFRGNTPIQKIQMVTVAANSLQRMMLYTAADADDVLRAYEDGEKIPNWARQGVALATRADIVPKRADGNFDGGGVMTRGDAAVMLYRMFMKIR
jgi:hypothetical protein